MRLDDVNRITTGTSPHFGGNLARSQRQGPYQAMYRHRRRRSSFSRRTPPQLRYVGIGAAIVVVIGLFIFFIRQADVLAPQPHEISVPVTDASKE